MFHAMNSLKYPCWLLRFVTDTSRIKRFSISFLVEHREPGIHAELEKKAGQCIIIILDFIFYEKM